MHLLLFSPRFPPSSAADSQRLRMLLPHFAAQGCSADVLSVDPACCADGLDPWQAEHLPAPVPIHRVRGLSRRWARLPGLGSIEARCYRALARAGSHLLRSKHFDAVYISTTAFGCFRLCPLWKRRHGVPFLLDYQDPWINDHYRRHPEITPPGGRFKYAVVDRRRCPVARALVVRLPPQARLAGNDVSHRHRFDPDRLRLRALSRAEPALAGGQPLGFVLLSPLAVFLGSISYGLYLWQQPFLTTWNTTFRGCLPLSLLVIFASALMSFHWIEIPGLRAKQLFSRST